MKLRYILPLLALFAMQSCSDKENNNGGDNSDSDLPEVTVVTELKTRAGVTTAFVSGDEMNLFAKSYNSAESDNKFQPRRAVYDGTSWQGDPVLRLKETDGPAFLFAVAPYNKSYTSPASIPVNIAEQTDLLYSSASAPVNFRNPTARMTMRHAFALVSFNILGSKEAKLQSISITGEKIFTSATYNVEKNRFTGTDQTQYTHPVDASITREGWTDNYPQMWFIPFSTKQSAATLTAVIDGKTYTAEFPEIEMKSGNQYIFRLTFSDYGLEFIESKTETIPLDQETDEFGDLADYGEITFTVTGNEWTLPAMDGMNVFGRFKNGEQTGSYRVDAVQTIKLPNPSADNKVGIETWNSSGFTVENLTGINEIDISAY